MRAFRQLTGGRWRSYDIWVDFVTMAACTISNAVDKTHFDEREALYLSCINKYSKVDQQVFPELFAYTVLALEENPEQDFLGDVYSELGLNSKEHMQIFTPYHVAHMMAEISLGNLSEQVEKQGYVSVLDTCCGAGATLIAAANVARAKLEKAGLNYQNHMLVIGQDIERIVLMMCYIQMSLLGVAGYFKVGNSLTEPIATGDSLENYWFTPMYYFPVWQYRRLFHGLSELERKVEMPDGEV
jgi:type I restriction-modification system DNA methylase subunit